MDAHEPGRYSIMGWFRTDPAVRLRRLRSERERILAELEVARESAAWALAGDDLFERAEGRTWQQTVDALEDALDKVDLAIVRAEIDTL